MNKSILIFSLLLVIILVGGCLKQETKSTSEVPFQSDNLRIGQGIRNIDSDKTNWKDIELKDVITGNKFKISDFKGKPILLESFAVWCPKCKQQQDMLKELKQEIKDAVVLVSLDTDPNEDEAKVLGHANRYVYDWLFTVSPVEYTQQLIKEFGLTVVSAPSTPIILVCEDQSARLLKSGIKNTDTLKSEIALGC